MGNLLLGDHSLGTKLVHILLLNLTLSFRVLPSSRPSERQCTDCEALTCREHGGPAMQIPCGANLISDGNST